MYGLTKTIAREKEDPNQPVVHDLFETDLVEITETEDLDGEILALTLDDLDERREFGEKKYGVPLQPFDGNRPMVEAFQEVLDAAIYLRQALVEEYSLDRDAIYLDCVKLLFRIRGILWWEDRGRRG